MTTSRAHLAREAHRHRRRPGRRRRTRALPIFTGWNTAGTALDARTAVPGVAAPEQDAARRCRGRSRRCRAAAASLDVEPAGLVRARSAPAPRRGSARGPETTSPANAVSSIAQRQRGQLGAAPPDCVQRRDQAAGRRAGDQVGPDARLLEHLDHADVGEAARRAAAERQADARRARRRPAAPAPAAARRRRRRSVAPSASAPQAGERAGASTTSATVNREARSGRGFYRLRITNEVHRLIRVTAYATYTVLRASARTPTAKRALDRPQNPQLSSPPPGMYQYTAFDRRFVHARAAQFRDQLRATWPANWPTTTSARCACRTAGTCSAMRRCCAWPCRTVS